MSQVPIEYLFSKKTFYIWPPIIIAIGAAVAVFNTFFPSSNIPPFISRFGPYFSKLELDYNFLVQHDPQYAVKYYVFSFHLIVTIILVTGAFTAWHVINLLRTGPRYPAVKGDNDGGMKYHLGVVVIVFLAYYISTTKTAFALPGDPLLFKFPLNLMGEIKWAAVYFVFVGFSIPVFTLDYLNRLLRLLSKKSKP